MTMPAAFVLAVGEPSLGRYTDGGFDLATPWVAVSILLVARMLGFRVRLPLVIAAALVAPLVVGLAHAISYPLTAALLLAAGWIASLVHHHGSGDTFPAAPED
jgi:hypothetical protein